MRKNARERKVITNDEMSVGGFVKIIAWLLIILIGFTLITMYVTRDKKEKPNNDIQYTNIIVGSILNRSEEDYFVLVEKEDDANIQNYQTMIDKYNNKDEHLRFYIVLLSDPFNASYVADEANLSVEKITDIRFSETTLLHIKNGKITSTRMGDAIGDYLNKLSA
ncbi:MAG: hypothetical protein J5970_04350 [Bacilli bacterium]|nr:hypothetical protein [Bacilli bacterium]MBP3259451.1 hypothetical protein [Bacilli bacterium]